MEEKEDENEEAELNVLAPGTQETAREKEGWTVSVLFRQPLGTLENISSK